MYLVFDIWHAASTLDEILDDFKILDFTVFEALAIVKDELLVVARYYFGIDVRYACFGV
jgi:hypothetical protein